MELLAGNDIGEGSSEERVQAVSGGGVVDDGVFGSAFKGGKLRSVDTVANCDGDAAGKRPTAGGGNTSTEEDHRAVGELGVLCGGEDTFRGDS